MWVSVKKQEQETNFVWILNATRDFGQSPRINVFIKKLKSALQSWAAASCYQRLKF